MQLNITGQNIDITSPLRDFMTMKFSKLEQFFNRINQVSIILKIEKFQKIAEATIHLKGGELYASSASEDMYAAIDLLIDKLTRQLQKHKKKLRTY